MASEFCVDCNDVKAVVYCTECEDRFCGLCFQWLHRRGSRTSHTATSLLDSHVVSVSHAEGTTEHFARLLESQTPSSSSLPMSDSDPLPSPSPSPSSSADSDQDHDDDDLDQDEEDEEEEGKEEEEGEGRWRRKEEESVARTMKGIKWIPMRLDAEERRILRLLEGALNVSEYTDKVDVSQSDYGFMGGSRREEIVGRHLNEVFALLLGLYVSTDFRAGNALASKSFSDNEAFFQRAFEIGRRYKILNPDKMRSSYGKMVHLLQDACGRYRSLLSFDCSSPILTVHSFLSSRGVLEALDNGGKAEARVKRLLHEAVRLVDPHRPSSSVQRLLRRKAKAKSLLLQAVSSHPLLSKKIKADEVERVVQSIDDHNSFIVNNCLPVDQTIDLLARSFPSESAAFPSPPSAMPSILGGRVEAPGAFSSAAAAHGASLAIRSGVGGSCLSHDHSTQWSFVMQSLQLWREIQRHMFQLWIYADEDLLDGANGYHLANTGQGLNRVQAAPRISRAMSTILSMVKSRMGRQWVGLSVVHLGDRDVPNALVFIDKYTQVPRILSPIVRTIHRIGEQVESDPLFRHLVDEKYRGADVLRYSILRDFFRHGFDGSGDDGGSCIDGRLTSAWNWCSLLPKKDFYHIFLLCDFEGFNGSYLQ